MRILSISLIAASTFFTPALVNYDSAEARPSTKSYSCSALKDFVRSKGAVVMNTKNNFVYDRFVANRSFCQRGETTERQSVPTRSGQCSINACKDKEFRSFR